MLVIEKTRDSDSTCDGRGILLRLCSILVLWGRESLLSWRSDAEHPSTSALD